MPKPLTRVFVQRAIAKPQWNLGNDVLYTMCRNWPAHRQIDAIIAKLWLIGRAYSAAIERRRVVAPGATGDLFYEKVAAPLIRRSGIDGWLATVRHTSPTDFATILEVHKELQALFARISGLEKRSLASKYLHFHVPTHFFIYDSRAGTSITQYTAPPSPPVALRANDPTYARFVGKCAALTNDVAHRFGLTLSPRQLDKVLLA